MTIYDLGRISAVLVVLDVVAVYLYCLRRKGVYPPSHPWSGITLLLLSVGMIVGFGNLRTTEPLNIFVGVFGCTDSIGEPVDHQCASSSVG